MLIPLLALALAAPPAPPTAPTRPPLVKAFATSPAAEPRPALKVELLPPLRDLEAGNAAVGYLRAHLQQPPGPTQPEQVHARQRKVDDWLALPLDQLPRDEIRQEIERLAPLLRDVDRAARSATCDWETERRLRTDGVAALLPDVQKTRELARWVRLRTRLELAEGRHDDAARSIQTHLQLARHVADSPTVIAYLVALALEAIAMESVDDWVSRPGSPNLYWALTSLPRPMLDARRALQGEEIFVETSLPNVSKLRRRNLPKDEAERAAAEAVGDLARLGTNSADTPPEARAMGQLGFAAYTVWAYPSAKKELIERGRPAAEVDAMPSGQVVFLASLERFLEARDEQWKWAGVPYHEARAGLLRAEEKLKKARAANGSDAVFNVLTMVIPATEKVLFAAARSERKVAILRALEAVRLYAAGHGGKPPAALADCGVPVPRDPMTGEAFVYAADGAKFTLSTPPTDARADIPLRYEVTLK